MGNFKFTIKEEEFLDYKRKLKARLILNQAVRKGTIDRPDTCELCECKKTTEAHHIDYGRPLEVFWLCSACHGLAHRKGHPLNPERIKQTKIRLGINRNDTINLLVNIDFETYAKLRVRSEESGKSISKIVKSAIHEKFGCKNQLEFNFEAKNDHTQSQKTRQSAQRVYCLGKDETKLPASKTLIFQKIRSQRQKSLFKMA